MAGTVIGKIERAEKGTIFLDEITEMPLALQARLMEVLQDKVLLQSEQREDGFR